MPSAVASAPGKVLLAGGYLILDRKHTGLVFGLNARIHVVAQDAPASQQHIVVQSPQFINANWRYNCKATSNGSGVSVTQVDQHGELQNMQKNPFVETALVYALSYVVTTSARPDAAVAPCSMSILADDDYYSQTEPKKKIAGFTDFDIPLFDAHKTGLGSSAALVTAFTAALLQYYLEKTEFDLQSEKDRNILHNLAQAAHSAAQGKVGSGFDVASAVYGSCVYRRFSPSILNNIGEVSSEHFLQRLKSSIEDQSIWDTEVVKSAVAIPSGLRLVMCDLDCGSKTPGMVNQVLQWRKTNADDANALWDELQSKNDALAEALVRTAQGEEGYDLIRRSIAEIRHSVQKMSAASSVPIEPGVITKLLDAVSEIGGVVGGVTPGAGGYDAVALLIEDSPEVVARLQNFLASWKSEGEDENSGIGRVQLLSVSGEMEGARAEGYTRYGAWLKE